MPNIRLFFLDKLFINLTNKLNKFQSHYLIKVMRLNKSKTFSLFNQSGEWEAKITEINKGIVEFNIIKQLRQKENPKELWLAFTPIKSNYFNFMIQKATELGITKFIPIITDRTVVRKINSDRLNKIIIEACEQSNRMVIPHIENISIFQNFLKKNSELDIVFGDINTNNKILNFKEKNSKKPVCVLIGPEGDFTENERKAISNLKNIQYLKINQNILRSETAAISAISIVNYFLNL